MEVKDRIKKELNTKNWSVYKLAKEANLAQSTLSDILSGKNKNPNLDTLEKIANALNIYIDKLTGESASSIIEDRLEEIDMTAQELAEKAAVPLKFLQNLNEIVPDLEIDLGEECYRYITSIAWILGIPGSKLRLAFARQEIPSDQYPSPDTIEKAIEAFSDPLPEGITFAADRKDGYEKPLTDDEAAIVEAAAKAALDAYRKGKQNKKD